MERYQLLFIANTIKICELGQTHFFTQELASLSLLIVSIIRFAVAAETQQYNYYLRFQSSVAQYDAEWLPNTQ
jgi:hypothetical protein